MKNTTAPDTKNHPQFDRLRDLEAQLSDRKAEHHRKQMSDSRYYSNGGWALAEQQISKIREKIAAAKFKLEGKEVV